MDSDSGHDAPILIDAAEDDLPRLQDLDQLTEFILGHDQIYLRYSEGPWADRRSGPSRDFEAGVDLPGLSVTTVVPENWWPRPAREWVARRLCKYAEVGEPGGRYPWLLTGTVVGRGPDHEPILVRARPLARIDETVVDEAKAVYVERFDVGRDSTG
ncbi:hypothetical protein IU438_26910 [Nocardia cyriacigeorgica]|jgi:hypothetical protein|uniref:DUF6098 family protein n=2 Tax=Nocardia cyriacigeorgica TaxID=135487 RepID=UPI0002F15EDD|nr:DUF6098 family protein [Nocardia cyriacigeorgica]AVH24135.1 hypothetical protein C5B73_24640 [Nocardia cyriacigeorgica]MBF6090073.1 hypothetical protein [Nocardia cyriacigeorgica]MBF6095990.1 hypothetical protein [Nocardia cyriacigeorgica]MBF6101503.1 hypothetical protein [Nocardia cyriacigeorgica]MBF6326388.1 hypothetical protein [Nocardia cyriacigeorgica]